MCQFVVHIICCMSLHDQTANSNAKRITKTVAVVENLPQKCLRNVVELAIFIMGCVQVERCFVESTVQKQLLSRGPLSEQGLLQQTMVAETRVGGGGRQQYQSLKCATNTALWSYKIIVPRSRVALVQAATLTLPRCEQAVGWGTLQGGCSLTPG